MPKLIFLDIDGTLLLPGRPMSQQVAWALRRAKQNATNCFVHWPQPGDAARRTDGLRVLTALCAVPVAM